MINNSKLKYIKSQLSYGGTPEYILELSIYGVITAFSLGYGITESLLFFNLDKETLISNIDNLTTPIGGDSEASDLLDDEEREDIVSTIQEERKAIIESIKLTLAQDEYIVFTKRLESEPIYFINSFEEAVIRTEIVDKELLYYVRFKGEQEFQAKKGSGIVAGGLEEHTIITKEEYEQH